MRQDWKRMCSSGADSDNESVYLRNDHEPIIGRDVWEAVQKRLDAKGMLGRSNIRRGGGRTHFLHGKLICGCCGELMTRRTLTGYSREGKEPLKYKAWECYGHHKGKEGNGCKQESIEGIDRVVITGQDIVVEKKHG